MTYFRAIALVLAGFLVGIGATIHFVPLTHAAEKQAAKVQWEQVADGYWEGLKLWTVSLPNGDVCYTTQASGSLSCIRGK